MAAQRVDALAYLPYMPVVHRVATGPFLHSFSHVGRLDAPALLPAAHEEGVAYLPGAACLASASGGNNIRLAFSQPSLDDIEEGIKRLGHALAAAL